MLSGQVRAETAYTEMGMHSQTIHLRKHQMAKSKNVNQLFDSEAEAQRFKAENNVFVRVPELISGRNKWALVFPLKAHVTVVPYTQPG